MNTPPAVAQTGYENVTAGPPPSQTDLYYAGLACADAWHAEQERGEFERGWTECEAWYGCDPWPDAPGAARIRGAALEIERLREHERVLLEALTNMAAIVQRYADSVHGGDHVFHDYAYGGITQEGLSWHGDHSPNCRLCAARAALVAVGQEVKHE